MPSTSFPPVTATRAATEADIPLLRELAERTWRASYADLIEPEQIEYMLARMYAREQIAREMRAGVIWELALAADETVGFFSVTLEEATRVKLDKLYVLPERQGAGIGRALLERVHALAAARGARQIWLQVNRRNARAIRVYERAGYVVARSAAFEIGRGFVMDDFIMQREITSAS
jgi:GNAT superfamily N-acetyltransferase